MEYPEILEPVLGFLRRAGVRVVPGTVSETSFLPGVEIRQGRLIYDETQLISPGDLLHEAGHVAVIPSAVRHQLSGDVDACLTQLADNRNEDLQILHTDLAPMAWSYAAARHAGIAPLYVFDAAGYGAEAGGQVELICRQLQTGLFPGIAMLARIGLCAAPPPFGDGLDPTPFPHMKRWLAA